MPIIVKQGNTGTTLDVLANDFPGLFGGPFLVPGDFVTFTTGNPNILGDEGVVTFNDVNDTLTYVPHPSFIGVDTFLYRVQDGANPPNFSAPAPNTLVTIHVTASDPKAVDDTRTVPFQTTPPATPQRLPGPDLLANDIKPANTRIVAGTLVRVTPGPAPTGELAQISTDGQTIDFRPATGFKGTVIYQYQIDDTDPLTSPSSAKVTIQVVDVNGAGVPQPAPSHFAQLEVQYLDLAGNPIVSIGPNQEFIVRVVATDIGPPNLDTDPANPPAFVDRTVRGVESAFLDLLYDVALATPVPSAENPLDFVVTFDGKLGTEATGGNEIADSDVQATPTPTATAFHRATGDLSLADDAYTGLTLVFTSGPLMGQRARIIDYVGATRRFVFETGSFTQPPGIGNTFRVERSLYNQNQSGTLNTPAAGAIDEIGGVHADLTPPIFLTGAGANTVFSARFRSGSNEGQFSVIGDPADRLLTDGINPPLDHRVFLANAPNPQPNELVPLTDEQVFLKSPAPLTITDGNPEFSNLRNPLDVNDDSWVSPVDALSVINSLNANGSRPVSQYWMAANGQLPGGFIDVNGDGFVAPLDALMVINFLNAGVLPEGEGESPGADEGEGEFFAALDDGEAALLFSVAESTPEGEVSAEECSDLPLPLALKAFFSNFASNLQSLVHSPQGVNHDEVVDLVADAVDELFEQLDCLDFLDFNPLRRLS